MLARQLLRRKLQKHLQNPYFTCFSSWNHLALATRRSIGTVLHLFVTSAFLKCPYHGSVAGDGSEVLLWGYTAKLCGKQLMQTRLPAF